MRVVMLHGLTASGACWAPVIRALGDGFDVITPDAHARSRYDELAADVAPLLDETTVLVGHSMGGMTAAVTATRAPLRALILIDPTFLEPERQREVFASDVVDQHRRLLTRTTADVVADLRARHPHRDAALIEALADARLRTPPEAFAILTPPNPDYRDVVRALTAPTLLVIGDHTVVTREMAAELAALNPRLRIAHIPGAGHGLPYDVPDLVGAAIRAFLLT